MLPKKINLLWILALFLATVVCGQNRRPKIGLVLSGGGAKGVAHIGILKAMEEAGLTPDYITGTSMGSIMGGLYAIGYTADELKDFALNIDWDRILTNKVPLDKVTFEEKAYYGRYLLDFYMKGKELQLPTGVIEGQALLELFSKITRPVHEISDFNQFPIPFACVAANIVTGEPVVLNKGSLALSMRASMAIPTVFTPVKLDGKLLVDGGLVRNMPVDEVKAMGADIVIGVFVSADLAPEEEMKSLVKILSQSALINSVYDSRKQLAKCDILIQPNLKGYSTSSFHSASGIYERGVEAGKQYVSLFKHLADSLKQIGPLHQIVKPAIQDAYTFDSIQIDGNKLITNDFIIGKMRFSPGKRITIEELDKRIAMTYGSQYFERITYQIHGEPGHRILKLHVVERADIQFRFSYFYDSENKGGIIGNATFRNLMLNNSRLILEAKLSVQPTVFADYFKYIGKKQNVALGLSGLFSKNELPTYDSAGVKKQVLGSDYFSGAFKIQSTHLQNSTYGMEVNYSGIHLKPKEAYETVDFKHQVKYNIDQLKYSSTKFKAFYQFNNLNDRYFPTRGMNVNLEISATTNTNGELKIKNYKLNGINLGEIEWKNESLGGLLETSTIKSLKLDFIPFLPLSKRLVLLSKAKLKLSTIADNLLNVTEYDFVGGFTPDLVNGTEFYGAGSKEFFLANYFYGRFGFQYEVRRNLFVQTNINLLTTEFPIKLLYPQADTGTLNGKSTRIGYALSIGMKSAIGPISLAVAKDNYRNGVKASLIIGFPY